MSAASTSQAPSTPLDVATRTGRWLFRHRTAAPLPVAIAVLTLRVGEAAPNRWLVAGGLALTAVGELMRMWAVRHIGPISRTRSERLGPLIASGPFAYVRNPLYIANIALWTGFAITARLLWLAPLVIALMGAAYHAIVRWEERLLESQLGDTYRGYALRVPRWVPTSRARLWPGVRRGSPRRFSWRDTLFSERGTLIAIAAGYALIWLKLKLKT
jgi:protein-S-isoprenylcysteine O-methyltransferase Ste14